MPRKLDIVEKLWINLETSLLSLLDPQHFKILPIAWQGSGADIRCLTVSYHKELMSSIDMIPNLILPPFMSKSVTGRKLEYLLGRVLAAQLMIDLGLSPQFPGRDDRRPVWPKGLIGSMTHTDRFVGCALALDSSVWGLGLDCEVIMTEDLFKKIRSHILTPDDETVVNKLIANTEEAEPGWQLGRLGTLIFSAKESLYKCLNPIAEVFFGFRDASLVSIDDHEIVLVLEKNLGKVFLRGRKFVIAYEFFDEKVFTCGTLLRREGSDEFTSP